MFEKSFSLIRTNPALTGNLKVVVDSSQNLYLEAFQATKTLSSAKYQHYGFQATEYYKELIPYFFDGVENSAIFYVNNLDDASIMYSDFQKQFDTTYHSGSFACEDTWYKEEYEYFAPLHLKKESLPTHFIVLRVDGSGLLNNTTTIDNFRSEIIDKWKFVSLTDLQEGTPFGSWLRMNFVSDESIRNYPLYINHQRLRLSEMFGIDTKKGGWATKYLNLEDVFSHNTPIFKSEEFFADLWEQNSVIYPNILNIKFLFDDTPATPTSLNTYSINRYFGFYADDMELVKQISPYKGFELNKVEETVISTLSAVECSQIPYVKYNLFVREVEGTIYSFDPIKNGWNDIYEYWVEFQGKQYRLNKLTNTRTDIIGTYLYQIVSDSAIEFDVNESDTVIASLLKRVLINDLSSFSQRVTIQPELTIDELTGRNIIGNTVNESYKTVKVIRDVNIEGVITKMFQIDLAVDDNVTKGFSIENFDSADLYLMQIDKQYFVIKKYDDETPGLGGKYYLQTDYAIEATENIVHFWINNGNLTKDPLYYTQYSLTDSKLVNSDGREPLVFNVYRVEFTDIKDFDFDRVYTEQASYEYEKSDEITATLEPKMYAKEYRQIQVNLSSSDVDSKLRRLPILDMNNRAYNQRAFNGDNNPFTSKPYTENELYQQTFEGNWKLFEGQIGDNTFSANKSVVLTIPRKYYREEHYILTFPKSDNEINFKATSLEDDIVQDVTWGTGNIGEISDPISDLPALQGANDPNKQLDGNYVPVSSEYIQSDELWEIRDNMTLSPIWNKNQSVCKWGVVNSKSTHDTPYRLNYSLDLGGLYNNQPNIYSSKVYPVRQNLDLDFFYRFGNETLTEDYEFSSLHLRENSFNSDSFLSTNADYFDQIFSSDQITSRGLLLTNKYSSFISDNKYEYPYTVFRGIKYYLQKVERVSILQDTYNTTGKVVIDEIITSVDTSLIDYKFSIVFGRKSSSFTNNPGNGDNNMGIDVYMNDVFKSVVIHVYIDTDDTIEVTDLNTGKLVNVETCTIDTLYQDNLENEQQDAIAWEETEFKVNSAGISLRARDFKLANILAILDNYNYEPSSTNKNKVQFIRCYANGTIKKMNYATTDFIIGIQQPDKFLMHEDVYKVNSRNSIVEFDVNNTVKNRIVRGLSSFSSDGLRVDSIADINSYNDYPIARKIEENAIKYATWQLDEATNPTVMRFTAAYAPIFKRVPMFLPFNSLLNGISKIGKGNWKFYDKDYNGKYLQGFAEIDEAIFSKVNPVANVLKLQNIDDMDKSIYPMVDEFGYGVDSRFLFSSNWEHDYYYSSQRIEIEPNEYPSTAGYTVQFDGKKNYMRIPDNDKFNLERFLLDDVNYNKPIYVKAWQSLASMPTTNTLLWNLGFGASLPTNAATSVGGYFKLYSDSGEIINHRYKATALTDYDDLVTKLNKAMSPLAYTVSKEGVDSVKVVNPTNFDFEPEFDSQITDGNSIVYVGTKTGGNGSTIKASVELKIYINQTPDSIDFSLISDKNGLSVISVNTSDNQNKLSANAFVLALSRKITDYDVSVTSTTTDYFIINIQQKKSGSLYNFSIDVGEKEYLVVNKTITAPLEKSVLSSFTKSSLKDINVRKTGYLNGTTVEFWVKFSSPAKKWETLVYKGEDTTLDVWKDITFKNFSYIIGRYEKTEHLSFKTCHKRLDGSTVTHNLIGKAALKVDTWYHIACVMDSALCQKSIYLNGELDVRVTNFIVGAPKSYTPDRELVYQFLMHRQRLLPGITFNRIGSEIALAERIKSNSTDTNATKWFDIIRGYKTLTSEDISDLDWQRQNWVATLPDAYAVFKDNYASYTYYLNTSVDNGWDILLGTDSVAKIGNRTFTGSLDELRIWNYGRTNDQVRDNYRFASRVETHLNPLESLVAYFRFDEGADATTIKDLMDNHVVKQQSRWSNMRNETVNDGSGAVVNEYVSTLVFENAFFAGSSISVDAESLSWALSGADIAGYSDERYSIDVPAKKVINVAPSPSVRTSDYVSQSLEQIAQSEANMYSSIIAETRVVDNVPVTGKSDSIRTLLRFPRAIVSLITGSTTTSETATIVAEALPPQVKVYQSDSGIVSTIPESDQGVTADAQSNPVIRGDIRISNSQENSNIFKRLFDYITNRRSK